MAQLLRSLPWILFFLFFPFLGSEAGGGRYYQSQNAPQSGRHPAPNLRPASNQQGLRPHGPGTIFPLPSGALSPAKPAAQPEPEFQTEPPAGSLIAKIHGSGVLGYVLLTPDLTGNRRTVIRVRLTGGSSRKEQFNCKIHTFPLQLGSQDCSPLSIGSVLVDISQAHGQLALDKETVISSSTIDLFGDKPLMGRTLVLHGMESGVFICATLMPATRKKVFEVKFHSPVSGTVRLIQTNTATAVLAEYMMYSNGTRKFSSHSWAFVEGVGADGTPESRYRLEATRCNGLRGQSLVSDTITVSTEMPGIKGRSFQVVRNVKPFEPILPVYMVLYEENDKTTVMACAPVVEIKPKTTVARFTSTDSSEVQGFISFSQESPFDPTKVEANLKLNRGAYSYGIDLIPTIRRRKNEGKNCPNIRETIYNPFFKDPEEIPPQGKGTSDQYAVGDLSGKYGTLANKPQEVFNAYDFNLPLFGYFSVVGRAVVIYAPDGPPVACANIEIVGSNITTVYATFDVPLQGQFIFRQLQGECSSDAYIYIEISKPDAPVSGKSFNHPWHVHEQPANAGFEHLSSTDCASAGPHLNPFNVSNACIYQRDCTIVTPLRCEVGDTTGKLGPIDIPTYKALPSGDPDVAKYYFIDTDLQLCGTTSIVGRSIVIHAKDFGSSRLTCANLLEFKPKA